MRIYVLAILMFHVLCTIVQTHQLMTCQYPRPRDPEELSSAVFGLLMFIAITIGAAWVLWG